MTFVKTALFHKAGEGSGGGGGGSDPHNLGFYADLTALQTAHPTGSDGDFAILGSTDTVWVWDSGTSAWKDTDTKGQVTSVNGQTGAVVIPDELPSQTGNSGKFLTTDGTDASWAAVGALPDQTGQSGKFLTTDGTDASWSDKPLVNTATGTNGINIGQQVAGGAGTVHIGNGTGSGANGTNNVFIGYNAGTSWSLPTNYSIAVGPEAYVVENGSVAIGRTAANSNVVISCKTGQRGGATGPNNVQAFFFENNTGCFRVVDSDGTIPTDRLTKVNSTITLTAAGWSSNTQTVNVTGMTATGVVMVSPDPTDQADYTAAGILCTAQAAGSLEFTCTNTPTNDIDVVVVML